MTSLSEKGGIMTRVLILCTQNSARSQMAEGLMRELGGDKVEVRSAGFEPAGVNPNSIEAMAEIGIDISGHRSESIDEYMDMDFDYVITVCGNAEERCPVFPGQTKRLHWPTDDPAPAEDKKTAFRNARDSLKKRIRKFVEEII